MKKILRILVLGLSLILLNLCAKPTVVDVVVLGDEELNCKQLEDAVSESLKIKREAEYAKEGTGGNIARVMLFWPAWAQTLHNADVAVKAANDRNHYLVNIMKKKNCKNTDKVYAQTISQNSSNDISTQLKSLNELYKSGALTENEFKRAKEKALSQ